MAIVSFNSCARQRFANARRKIYQRVEVLDRQVLMVIVYEEKPVATPGHVTCHWSKTRHVNGHVCGEPVTRHVRYFDFTVLIELRHDHADRRFDAMHARTNAIK